MKASIALLLSGLAVQQVAATWDRQAPNFNTPGYNNNECTDKQKGGYDWSDLKDGDKPGKYDDFNFDAGWSCSTKKFGKRDHVTKRSFGAKAITNSCGREKPASFSCGKKDGFSVTHMDISVDHDADLDFHYKMKDGSICKQRTSCKKEGTTVQNTQCGGAQSVDVYLGNSSQGKDSCNIGVHQVGFDCNPGQSYIPPPPFTPPPPAPPSTSSEKPSSSAVKSSSSSEVSKPPKTTAPPKTSDSPPPPKSSSAKTPCGYGQCGSSGFHNSSAPPAPPSSSPVEIPSSSAEVSTSSSSEQSSSAVVSTPAPSAPESSSSAPASSSPATQTAPINNGTVPSVPASSQPPTVTPPPGGYTPPQCLPKCLNTWLKIKSECKDNTDSACYCKIPDLTDNVIDCVKAYGTDEEIKQALSYFVGICAPQLPENPHIIDKCTGVPLAPPTASVPQTTAAPQQPQTPGTTPPPAPQQPGSIPCTTITQGGSTYTVPQVGFTTETPGAPGVNPTEPIALVPAPAPTTPAPAPANPTPVAPGAPYPVPSGASGFTSVALPTGTGAANKPPPAQFSGSASTLNVKAGMVFGAAFAFFAM